MSKNYKVGKFYLDDFQMQLLENDENTIVIAGAGSGKTLTIIGKINYLIENHYAKPDEILVISFTNASVNDIKAKIEMEIPVFTFHKLAIFILEKLNFEYSICPSTLLDYIISEKIRTTTPKNQKLILKFLQLNVKFTKFIDSKEFLSFCRLIATFINLWKTNSLNFTDLPLNKYTKLEKKILLFIFDIYQKYISEKQASKKLDFDDLIIFATENISKIVLPFKYIIIDEFQDTSAIRLNLIRAIFNNTLSKIIVVGDDWQSIYRFSGCDVELFINFSKIFPNVKTIKLVNTYRNSQELIAIASDFITRNPYQIKKQLAATKTNNNPIIFAPYKNKINTLKKLLRHLLLISNDVMILTRNNKDIYEYIDEDYELKENILIYLKKEIKLYTVHKSKGLEASYVIILNCNNETLGFPNQIEDNPLLKKLFSYKEIKYAEERRLFYVAITRCKEQTFLIYDKNNPSIFIKEIKKIVKVKLKKLHYFK